MIGSSRGRDPLSNVFPADEALLAPDGIPIPPANVHPFPTDEAIRDGRGPDWCAATYAAEVVSACPPSTAGRRSMSSSSGSAATATCCRSFPAARPCRATWSRWRSRPRATSSPTSSGSP